MERRRTDHMVAAVAEQLRAWPFFDMIDVPGPADPDDHWADVLDRFEGLELEVEHGDLDGHKLVAHILGICGDAILEAMLMDLRDERGRHLRAVE